MYSFISFGVIFSLLCKEKSCWRLTVERRPCRGSPGIRWRRRTGPWWWRRRSRDWRWRRVWSSPRCTAWAEGWRPDETARCRGTERCPSKAAQTSTESFRNRNRKRNVFNAGGGLTHWTRDGVLRPARSMALKTMKQQTQVNTLSVRDREQDWGFKHCEKTKSHNIFHYI